MTCKVSVIIPIYNVEKYLQKSLNSVCAQTLEEIEIICINDCSPDNSLEILKEYQRNDNRIKIINFKENKGVAVARNEGIKIAQGEYIGFVDPDDWVDLDFFEKLYISTKNSNADLVKTKFKKVYDNKEEIIDNYRFFWCGIYKKEFLDKNNIQFKDGCICGEDQIFIAKSDILASKKVLLEYPYYYYRQRIGSASYNKIKNDKQFTSDISAFKDVFRFIAEEFNKKRIDKYTALNEYLLYHANYLQKLNRVQAEIYVQLLQNSFEKIQDKNKVLNTATKKLYKDLKKGKIEEISFLLNTIKKQKKLLYQLREKYQNNS